MFRSCLMIAAILTLLMPVDAFAQFANAAHLQLSADGDSITLTGAIGLGTGKAFVDMAGNAPLLRMLRLESPGGLVGEARIVAQAVQKMGLDTYVAQDCYSACTMIFYAGKSRWMRPDAHMGFHGYGLVKGKKATHDQLDAAQNVDRKHYLESGLPDWFVDKIFETPNSSIWLPTSQELLAAKFVTNLTVDDDPLGQPAHDGLPAVNHPMAAAGNAPLPNVIGP